MYWQHIKECNLLKISPQRKLTIIAHSWKPEASTTKNKIDLKKWCSTKSDFKRKFKPSQKPSFLDRERLYSHRLINQSTQEL